MRNPIVSQRPSDEDTLQAALADVFRANDWIAVREYTPDRSNHRIDIFAEHDDYGQVGIEDSKLHVLQQSLPIWSKYWVTDTDDCVPNRGSR